MMKDPSSLPLFCAGIPTDEDFEANTDLQALAMVIAASSDSGDEEAPRDEEMCELHNTHTPQDDSMRRTSVDLNSDVDGNKGSKGRSSYRPIHRQRKSKSEASPYEKPSKIKLAQLQMQMACLNLK